MMRLLPSLLFFALSSACRCNPIVTQVAPAKLVAVPERLALPAIYVGQSTSAVVTLTNEGGAPSTFEPTIDPPFSRW